MEVNIKCIAHVIEMKLLGERETLKMYMKSIKIIHPITNFPLVNNPQTKDLQQNKNNFNYFGGSCSGVSIWRSGI